MATKTPARPAKTTTPKAKAAAKKAAPAAARHEEPSPAAPAETAADSIMFMGRTMLVQAPSPEQLSVWQRLATRAQAMTGAGLTGDGAARLFGRAHRVIESVLVDEHDREWLEDQFLDRALTLEQAADILTLTVNVFQARIQAQVDNTPPKNGPTVRRRR